MLSFSRGNSVERLRGVSVSEVRLDLLGNSPEFRDGDLSRFLEVVDDPDEVDGVAMSTI